MKSGLVILVILVSKISECHRQRAFRPVSRARARFPTMQRQRMFGAVGGYQRHRVPPEQKYFHQDNPIFGVHPARAKEHAIINGQYMETSRVLIQRRTFAGVGYFAHGFPKVPVFIRREREMNKKHVVFQDPYLPPGEGYLVVLKRIPLNTVSDPAFRFIPQIPIPEEIPYEAFHMVIGNNIHGSFNRVNVRRFAYGVRTQFYGREKARQQLSQWRKLMSHSYKRFGMSRWRGKRDTASANSSTHTNVSLEHYATLFRNDDNHQIRLNPCSFKPLNISQLRLRLISNQTLGATDLSEDTDFQYAM